MTLDELSWVDNFVLEIKEYICVREKDNLLILLPNNAYKLNASGLYILKQMIDGGSIASILQSKFGDNIAENVIDDLHYFFCDLRSLVSGCLCNVEEKKAVDIVRFTRPHNLLPVLSEIALTYSCNLACRFCYAGCKCSKKPDIYESNTAEIKHILNIIKNEAQVPSVSWTGGEPTLRADLVELTEYASKELGMRVNLITNGTNLDEDYVIRLKAAGIKSAQISLEAGNAADHDYLTQVQGSFDRTVAAVALFKKHGVNVHTNTTLNSYNKDGIEELVEFISTLNTGRFSMNLIIPTGSAAISDLVVSYTETADIIKKIMAEADKYKLEFMWYSPTPYCIFNPVKNRLGGKSCAACDGLLSVAPNGDVLPCSSLPSKVGNILKQSFSKVWDSKKSLYWRNKKYAHKICRECDIFDICTGACPIYWKYMGYDELNGCKGR